MTALLLALACVKQSPPVPAAVAAPAFTGVVASRMPVWVDCDPSVGMVGADVDDGYALLQVFASPELELQGVSVVFGNAPQPDGVRIGGQIVADFGPDVAVYGGALSAEELGQPNAATDALIAALEGQRMPVLMLGPATNVATVLMLRPDLAGQISELVAVAGRRPGQRFTSGDASTKAFRDFNFELDPQAFQVLLDSGVPLTLAPYEISSKVWLGDVELERLSQGGPGARSLVGPSKVWLKMWRVRFGAEGFNPFDTLAVARLTHPELLSCEGLPVEIQRLPDDRVVDEPGPDKPYLLLSKELQASEQALYCYDVAPEFRELLLTRVEGI